MKVSSSAIEDVVYSSRTRTLKIKMKDRARMAYYDVPPGVYKEFLESDSQGRYFNQYIREHYQWDYIA